MDEQLIILKNFPFLVPQNGQFTVYEGYISAGNEEFMVSLSVPKYPSLENLSINLPWKVEVCLNNNKRDVDKWKGNCTTLLTFLECLKSEVEESMKSNFAKQLFRSGDRMPVEFYEKLINSLSCINEKNIRSISTNMDKIELTTRDVTRNCHEHVLVIQYNIAEPNSPPCVHAELPASEMRKLETGKDKDVITIFDTFKDTVRALSDFWDVMDEIDKKCWVILPEEPKLSDTFRRIALGQHVSLEVSLDPSCVQKVPDLNFFGPEQVVEQLVDTMQRNIPLWPEGQSFVDSLQFLLGGDVFPSNPEKEAQSGDGAMDMECMICCSVLLGVETPTEVCGNNCGAVYHTACISQWLMAIASCNDSAMSVKGKCPSCNVGIVKISNVK
ncbi:E3 ubiquitin-protein ligase FANCL-like [Bacillus rossius redtenbacheri]|uniref:E3 ubiquitin-protein ligase FANCL-like n=1 Tax=Bacillus rossius redtenbacheri TaxID=93214 RepID=UPI002FDE7145